MGPLKALIAIAFFNSNTTTIITTNVLIEISEFRRRDGLNLVRNLRDS